MKEIPAKSFHVLVEISTHVLVKITFHVVLVKITCHVVLLVKLTFVTFLQSKSTRRVERQDMGKIEEVFVLLLQLAVRPGALESPAASQPGATDPTHYYRTVCTCV